MGSGSGNDTCKGRPQALEKFYPPHSENSCEKLKISEEGKSFGKKNNFSINLFNIDIFFILFSPPRPLSPSPHKKQKLVPPLKPNIVSGLLLF